jgi:hypothetical protein
MAARSSTSPSRHWIVFYRYDQESSPGVASRRMT